MRKFLLSLCIILIASSVAASENWVFTPYEADSMMSRVSYSAAVSGMGECGVSSVDPYSFYYNPGSIGFLADEQLLSISFNPYKRSIPTVYYDYTNPKFSFYSIAFSLKSFETSFGHLSLGAAYYIDDLKSKDIYVYWLYEPYNVNDTTELKTDNFVLGFSLKGQIEFGAGVTLRKIKSNQIDTDFGDNWGYHFGFMARKKFILSQNDVVTHTLTPTVGITWKNYGDPYLRSVDDYGDYSYTQKRTPISTRYLGGSIKYCYTRNEYDLIEITTALEYERRLKNAYYFMYDYNGFLDYSYMMEIVSAPKVGLEVGFIESLYLRFGKIHQDKYGMKIYTWGYTLSTDGLFKKLKANSGMTEFLKRLSIQFSVAGYYTNDEQTDFYTRYSINPNHDRVYSISLSFR